ncbi:TrkA family potassium uptake protein [Acaryochloris sp. IP29b_bin.148]|uniref:potassium channel family protein n=1 Tax=Acaryochloris sp. IP29b_bin.148 TaxID=2969218 RepID=UPI002604E762|nr:potassium channel protein [Acaryochloris sp. IP29b_bin.148]
MYSILEKKYQQIQRELFLGIGAFGGVIVSGTLWYWLVERWPLTDALYMTVITLSTVGFMEVNPLSDRGRLFTIVLIIVGVIWLGYIANRFTEAVIQGYFRDGVRLQQQRRLLDELSGHFILCGFGRTGQQIAQELSTEAIPFVVIDQEAELIEAAQNAGYMSIQGGATNDQTLLQAGIQRATGLITTLASDADNLYTVLSAKNLNAQIRAIVRANSEDALQKMQQVGVDAVVAPYMTVGKRMVAAALRPQVVNFMDVALTGSEPAFYIEELLIDTDSCPYIGQSLGVADVRSQTGASILAIRRANGELIGSPSAQTKFCSQDLLICMGTTQQLQALNQALSTAGFS